MVGEVVIIVGNVLTWLGVCGLLVIVGAFEMESSSSSSSMISPSIGLGVDLKGGV